MKASKNVALSALALLVMAGCASTPRDYLPTSQVKQIVDDPSPFKKELYTVNWLKEGIFPNLENLSKIQPGLTKEQIYHLIGVPHFNSGIAFVNDWDYIMNFRKFTDRTYNGVPGDGSVVTCHYKVKFDRQSIFGPYKVTGTEWKEQGCPVVPDPLKETVVREIVQQPAPAPSAPLPPQVLNLNADALFAFDKWTLNMTTRGRAELAKLTSFLSGKQYDSVELIGHTDQLGSEAYNQRLSERRARTIANYLVQQGVPASKIIARGAGESMPAPGADLASCPKKPRSAQISCLQPSRRVTVQVNGLVNPPTYYPQGSAVAPGAALTSMEPTGGNVIMPPAEDMSGQTEVAMPQ